MLRRYQKLKSNKKDKKYFFEDGLEFIVGIHTMNEVKTFIDNKHCRRAAIQIDEPQQFVEELKDYMVRKYFNRLG